MNINQFVGQAPPFEPFILVPWDQGADAWGTSQTFAPPPGGLFSGPQQMIWCALRPDGTKLLFWNREVVEDDERVRVEIYQDTGSGFTAIGSFDLGSGVGDLFLYGSKMATDGTIHTFLHGTSDFGNTYQLYHASLSTSNIVSSLHLIDTIDIDDNELVLLPNPLWNELALSSTEIAFGYPFQMGDPRFESPNELRVVRGDLTADPLNPTFTVETITSTILL